MQTRMLLGFAWSSSLALFAIEGCGGIDDPSYVDPSLERDAAVDHRSVDAGAHDASRRDGGSHDPDAAPPSPFAVAGFTHVAVSSADAGAAPDANVVGEDPLYDTAGDGGLTCACEDGDTVASSDVTLVGDCSSWNFFARGCRDLFDADGGTSSPLYPGFFDHVLASAEPTFDRLVAGKIVIDGGITNATTQSVKVWTLEDPSEAAPAGMIDCELATDDVACPASYPERRALKAVEDTRICLCNAHWTQTAPTLSAHSSAACGGAATATFTLADSTCAPILFPPDTKSVDVEATESFTRFGEPQYLGAWKVTPSTLCCPSSVAGDD